MGSEGDSYDNALAETINGLKAEVIYRRGPWRSSELVDIPPAKAEEPYYAQAGKQP